MALAGHAAPWCHALTHPTASGATARCGGRERTYLVPVLAGAHVPLDLHITTAEQGYLPLLDLFTPDGDLVAS